MYLKQASVIRVCCQSWKKNRSMEMQQWHKQNGNQVETLAGLGWIRFLFMYERNWSGISARTSLASIAWLRDKSFPKRPPMNSRNDTNWNEKSLRNIKTTLKLDYNLIVDRVLIRKWKQIFLLECYQRHRQYWTIR